ncbi:MAG: hypothetical protein M0Z27_10745 [Thermaerobacter sp.]|nr:hypothetical protein [Thermaerobacter sp.]
MSRSAPRREAGSWYMLAAAALVGLAAGRWLVPGALTCLAAAAAWGAAQGPPRRRWLLGAASLALGAWVLFGYRRPGMLLLGAAAVALLLVRRQARRGSWVDQGAGIALTAALAPGVAYAAGGTAAATAAAGLAVAAHLTGGLVRVRRATGRARISPAVPEAVGALALGAAAGAGWAPPLLPLAFLPGLWRSAAGVPRRPRGPDQFRRLGRQEVLITAGFVALFALATRIGAPASWQP